MGGANSPGGASKDLETRTVVNETGADGPNGLAKSSSRTGAMVIDPHARRHFSMLSLGESGRVTRGKDSVDKVPVGLAYAILNS